MTRLPLAAAIAITFATAALAASIGGAGNSGPSRDRSADFTLAISYGAPPAASRSTAAQARELARAGKPSLACRSVLQIGSVAIGHICADPAALKTASFGPEL
jgi:hypothetical protein